MYVYSVEEEYSLRVGLLSLLTGWGDRALVGGGWIRRLRGELTSELDRKYSVRFPASNVQVCSSVCEIHRSPRGCLYTLDASTDSYPSSIGLNRICHSHDVGLISCHHPNKSQLLDRSPRT